MTPRPYTGRLAGLDFKDGEVDPDTVGTLTEVQAAAKVSAVEGYALRQGLVVDDEGRLMIPDRVVPEPPDPRHVGRVRQGRIRDAAVDPRPGDFLAPTNAGEANPHGPDVVNPEIHASEGVRPIKGGQVHVGDPAVQDLAEMNHTEAVHHEGTPGAVDETVAPAATAGDPPAKSANKPDWVAFAVASGLDQASAEALTKDELIAGYGPKDT